jgi:hypothetical protein
MSFYKQFFFTNKVPQVTMRVHKNVPQSSEALQPYFKESKGIQASVTAFLQDLPSKYFFPTICLMQERRKNSTKELPTRRVKRFAVKFFILRFAQFKESKGFYTTSYIQGQRSVCPKPRIPFFVSRVLGFRSNLSWLKYWLLRD